MKIKSINHRLTNRLTKLKKEKCGCMLIFKNIEYHTSDLHQRLD